MPYVVIQKDGRAEPFREWPVEDASSTTHTEVEELAWEQLCDLLVEDALMCTFEERERVPVNVFLIFDREELEERDRIAMEVMLKRARERTWGARLYLVLLDAPSAVEVAPSARANLGAWMAALIDGRLTDIIQPGDVDLYGDAPGLHRRLRDCASSAVERRRALREVSARKWRCAAPAEVATLLGPQVITRPDDDRTTDLLIALLPPEAPGEEESEIERFMAADPLRNRSYRVVTHRYWADTRLKEYCRDHGLGEPIFTGGDFELWFLLLQLNAFAGAERYVPHAAVLAVSLDKAPRLRALPSSPFPTLLVTSVFDPDEAGQWHEAAQDIGTFLVASPPAVEFHIEMCVNPDRLKSVVRKLGAVDVWVHIGHGRGESKLWAPEGNYPKESWVWCFDEQELQLVLFLTCHSDEIAKYFAEQGAAVAIGFKGEIDPAEARKVAVDVIPLMLAEATRRRPIVDGFQTGDVWLRPSVNLENAGPRAYHPRRT